MSGIAEGGGREMDGDTDRGVEDRRRDIHTLLSIDFLVTNYLSPARPNMQTHMNLLITSTHVDKHTLIQAVRHTVIYCLVLPITSSNP